MPAQDGASRSVEVAKKSIPGTVKKESRRNETVTGLEVHWKDIRREVKEHSRENKYFREKVVIG